MTKRIYLGNLPHDTDIDDIKDMLADFGKLENINLIKNPHTKKFKGFVFIDMDPQSADDAIIHLNGSDYNGRVIRAEEARVDKNIKIKASAKLEAVDPHIDADDDDEDIDADIWGYDDDADEDDEDAWDPWDDEDDEDLDAVEIEHHEYNEEV